MLGEGLVKSLFLRQARGVSVIAAACLPRLALSGCLAAAFALFGVFTVPAAADDPFQRDITFRNDLPIAIYPVITADQIDNCATTKMLRRIIVNYGQKGAGIPPGQTVKVNIPKSPHCWYNAARVYIFSVDLTKFETRLNADEQTVADGAKWDPPLCADDACWTGTAVTQYPIDAPAQLLEYTMFSQGFVDPNGPQGIPFVDLDISFVDSVYLPVAINLEDHGATRYMGTALPYDTFNQRSQAFLGLEDTAKHPVWSEFAAYSPVNWPNNVFSDLVSKRTDQVEGAYNLVHNVLVNSTSALYTPTYKGAASCQNSENPICMKAGLVGNCCPAQNGTFLTCCAVAPYLIDNTTKTNQTVADQIGTASNPSADSFVQRWTTWITSNPCTDLSKITEWPGNLTAFNKQAFCDTFEATAKYVWDQFAPICAGMSGPAKDQCIVDQIVGYESHDAKGQLPESVQALQRSVPWGDPTKGQLQYSFDKFILFWAPYDSIFNLNPYTRFVHNPTDGLDAPGAYSFSIDDRYGNFQSSASGFIVDAGATTALLNKEAYDPYEQYDVGFATGWDHATVCGRAVSIPGGNPGNAPISFWLDGVHQTSCDLAFFADSAGTEVAKYRVTETSKTVTDTYTGSTQSVTELTLDNNYCETNSSPALVAAAVCINSNVSPNFNGDVAYVSVLPDAEKPNVHLNLPKNPQNPWPR